MLKVYDCVGDLARHAAQCGKWSGVTDGGTWTNNETFSRSVELTISGNDSLVPEAEKMMDKLETHIQTPNIVWERAVAGAFPVVADFLAGELECMRSRQPTFTDRSPVKVLVDVSTSGTVRSEQIKRRGVAILSLVMALTSQRPVELYGVSLGDGKDGWTMLAYRINTLPLDLSSSCYTLTSSGFDRNVCMTVMNNVNGFKGSWPDGWSQDDNNDAFYRRNMPSFVDDNTLIVGAAMHGDPLLDNPLGWVNNQLKRFGEVLE